MRVLLRPPQFGGAEHADDHKQLVAISRSEVGLSGYGVDADGQVVVRRQLKALVKLPRCVTRVLKQAANSWLCLRSQRSQRRRRAGHVTVGGVKLRWRCSRYIRSTCSRVRVFAKRARKAVISCG